MSGRSAIFELVRMRVLLLTRQPEVMFWAFIFPILISVVLGLAFRDARAAKSRVAVLDGARADAVVRALSAAADVEVERATDADAAMRRLRSGAVDLVVSPGGNGEPGRKGEPVRDGETGKNVELRHDPARVEGELARARAADALQVAEGRADRVQLDAVPVQGAGSRFVDWFLPGLLGLSVMSTSVWGVGFAFVEARQKKLIRRLLVTPMRRSQFLLAHVLARLVLLVLEVTVLLLFASFVLGVPFRGSIAAVYVLCAIGALAFAGVGVLLGSRARTPEAAAGLINLAMMPMGLASGVFFSYERFSDTLQPWIRALPLTAFNDALRGVILEGHSLLDVAPLIAIQVVWGVVAFVIGLFVFRWQ